MCSERRGEGRTRTATENRSNNNDNNLPLFLFSAPTAADAKKGRRLSSRGSRLPFLFPVSVTLGWTPCRSSVRPVNSSSCSLSAPSPSAARLCRPHGGACGAMAAPAARRPFRAEVYRRGRPWEPVLRGPCPVVSLACSSLSLSCSFPLSVCRVAAALACARAMHTDPYHPSCDEAPHFSLERTPLTSHLLSHNHLRLFHLVFRTHATGFRRAGQAQRANVSHGLQQGQRGGL